MDRQDRGKTMATRPVFRLVGGTARSLMEARWLTVSWTAAFPPVTAIAV
jgi:hypothetical protein